MKKSILYIAASLCIPLALSVSCVKNVELPPTEPTSNEKYFNFSSEQNINISINYGFSNKDYIVLFGIYDQNPLTTDQDGQSVKKDIEPLYRAATDGEGKFTATISLPSAVSKIWLYSDYVGTLSPIELEITNSAISFNQNDYLDKLTSAKSKAVTNKNHKYPDGWGILGDWNPQGRPDYLADGRKFPEASLLYGINKIFVEYNKTPLQERYPDFFKAGMTSSIHVIKNTKVYLTFINGSASWRNTVGYFTYPTGQEPQSPTDVKRIIAFPNVTPLLNNGALAAGERVHLKYWDGVQFQDEIPAGVSVGWWMEGMSFGSPSGNPGDIIIANEKGGGTPRFSLDHLNTDGVRRTVALGDPKSGRIVALGFEDNLDKRYNDATFYLEVAEEGALDDTNIPTIPDIGPPSKDDNYVVKEGTLLFEDLWPSAGDYDMNDVIVTYKSKVYKNIVGNTVYKIVDEYTPYHSGGFYTSGFGVNYANLASNSIHTIQIKRNNETETLEGLSLLEPEQTHPTLILMDNIRAAMGRPSKEIVVTIEFNDVTEASVAPPYNPFIISEFDKSRGKEVHLPKFLPTDKADKSLFGTGNDGSKPLEGLYYVNNRLEKQYPFALNMPSVMDMPVPNEGVNIDITYPDFRGWVESNGKNNKDWYLKPAGK